ncbi:MAG: sulfite exporter TauE/SafE family protein [Acutalibacteraceae bacterium]
MKKTGLIAAGLVIGLINALFGAGGGLVAVAFLLKNGLSQKQAQATALCIILPLSVISSFVYIKKGYVGFEQAKIFLPYALIGAVIGTALMNKISNKLLNKVFAVFMLWAGLRLIFR